MTLLDFGIMCGKAKASRMRIPAYSERLITKLFRTFDHTECRDIVMAESGEQDSSSGGAPSSPK